MQIVINAFTMRRKLVAIGMGDGNSNAILSAMLTSTEMQIHGLHSAENSEIEFVPKIFAFNLQMKISRCIGDDCFAFQIENRKSVHDDSKMFSIALCIN